MVTNLVTDIGSSGTFLGPAGIAVDSNGNVFVTDLDANFVFKISVADGSVSRIASTFTFSGPYGIVVNAAGTAILVAETWGEKIRLINLSTNTATLIYTAGAGSMPFGIAVDSTWSNVYVCEFNANAVRKISLSSPYSTTTLLSSTSSPALSYPRGVALDSSGNVYLSDGGNKVVRRIAASNGAVTSVGTSASPAFGGDGTNQGPNLIAVDNSGNLIVAEYSANLVRKISGV
jgi:DNA-binding beta-propeller fold protein YncE